MGHYGPAAPAQDVLQMQHLPPAPRAGAITALLEAKPHLAKRAPSGDVGAGVRGEVDAAPDLISIMRGM